MIFQRYALGEILHQGSGIALYRGRRLSDGAPVAVKISSDPHPSQRDTVRVRHEFNILSSLPVQGVVRVIALEPHGHGLALVMEDLGGRPLSALLRDQQVDLTLALQIAISLSEVVADVHRHRIIHKDIKPANVVVNFQPLRVKLIDFGIATSLVQEAAQEVWPDELEGTLAYLSPEQTGRMNRPIDVRSDLYSLGVTFYELFTGGLPFRATDALELVHSHIARVPVAPHVALPSIPEPLSAIVMRLMAKASEDRYQSATGLRFDLEECLAQYAANGRVAPFEIGTRDFSSELRIPQKLYGRDDEIGKLLACFERIRKGSAELFLVAGDAGSGKSSLVHELHKPIAQRGGLFLSGKFDQFDRSAPFLPFAHALRELVRRVLAEGEDKFATMRADVLRALGANGAVVIQVVPELEKLIGPQPPVADLGPTEAQNRFSLVLQDFLRVFTKPEHPVVLFLDDLQWADGASRKLLHLLMTDPQRGHLLIVGAYRRESDEGSAVSPLASVLQQIEAESGALSRVLLGPLALPDVAAFVGDTFRCSAERGERLARHLHDKTLGNPFFLTQLVRGLHEDRLVHVDADGRWSWDIDAIAAAPVTPNVVAFMAEKLDKVNADTERTLKHAACVGYRFDLELLALIDGTTIAAAGRALWDALEEGFVVPQDSRYRFFGPKAPPEAERAAWLKTRPGTPDARDARDTSQGSLNATFRFAHDRVHQAAYERMSEAERTAVHLKIGRVLRGRIGNGDPSVSEAAKDQLFEMVRHLNAGASLIDDPVERRGLARLDLQAGKKAKQATAFEAAAGFLGHAMAMLPATSWEDDYELTLEIYVERVECEFVGGNLVAGAALAETLKAKARTTLDRARVINLLVKVYAASQRVVESLALGREGLALFGIDIPETPELRRAATVRDLKEIEPQLAAFTIADLEHAPELTDEGIRWAIRMLVNLIPASFMIDAATMYPLIGARLANLTIKYGLSAGADVAFAVVGSVDVHEGRYMRGCDLGKIALAINEKLGLVEHATVVNYLAAYLGHFRESIRTVIARHTKAYQSGFDTGDIQFMSFSAHYTIGDRIAIGDPIPDVIAQADDFALLMKRTKSVYANAALRAHKQYLLALRGQTAAPDSLNGEGFDEDEFLADAEARFFATPICTFQLNRLELRFLHGDLDRALISAEAAVASVLRSPGHVHVTRIAFFSALVHAARLRLELTDAQRAVSHARLTAHLAQLATWAELCPENTRHCHQLVDAEARWSAGDELGAMHAYDQAIESAREHNNPRDHALANELAGKFHLAAGRPGVARAYLAEAHFGYARWGATTKVEQLERYHPELFLSAKRDLVYRTRGSTSRGASTTGSPVAALDIGTVLKAAHAFASELALDKVLERLMRVLVENAGAQRGYLLLMQDNALRVEASFHVDADTVRVGSADGLGMPLASAKDELSVAIVQYVGRTREVIALAQPAHTDGFSADPYLMAREPAAVLALPLTHQGQLVGVLYFEHGGLEGAFSGARVELVKTLAELGVIAVENARLYERLRATSDELKNSNASLERTVAQRTAELRRTVADLWSEMDVARKIQTLLLPDQPRLEGYDVAAKMRPAALVGGDYYDVIRAGKQDWVVIGDVAGHGVPAGLVMMMVQTAMRSTIHVLNSRGETASPARVIANVNQAIWPNLRSVGDDIYVTLTALAVEGGRLTFSGLHQNILIYRAATRTVESIETRGVWLGLFEDISKHVHDDSVEIAPGDMVLVFTDGLTEAKIDGKIVGEETVGEWYSAAARDADARGADVAAQYVLNAVVSPVLAAPLRDDVTVLVLRRRDPAAAQRGGAS